MKLLQHIRGPEDKGWHAQFHIDGAWVPRTPLSLGTRDFDEAVEQARDRIVLVENGQPVAAKPRVEHSFRVYAEAAIARLEGEAIKARHDYGPGKDHKFRDIARRIRRDLMPRWAETPIDRITEEDLNDWVEDEYQVIDQRATVSTFGRQARGRERQVVMKPPSFTTLGNLDWALMHVWKEAARGKVVSKRGRPVINKDDLGQDGEQRPFIDRKGVRAAYRTMSDSWVLHPSKGHSAAYRRLLRAYVALLAATGIRPGLELRRVKIHHVRFERHEERDVILVDVMKNQGKGRRERVVVVHEGMVFPIRSILRDLLTWHRVQGATPNEFLFRVCPRSFGCLAELS